MDDDISINSLSNDSGPKLRVEYPDYLRKMTIKEMLKASNHNELLNGRNLLHEELLRARPDESVIKQLIQKMPERVSAPNEHGSIALHVACNNINSCDSSVILILLDAYPDGINIKNNLGLLPIHKAAMKCSDLSVGSLSILIDFNNNCTLSIPNKENQLPLHLALASPKVVSFEVIQTLVDSFPRALSIQDIYGHTPLHKACAKNNLNPDIIEFLIDKCNKSAAVKDCKGMLPLHWVVLRPKPSFETVFFLLDSYPTATIETDDKGRKPLDIYLSLSENLVEIIQQLVGAQQKVRQSEIEAKQKLEDSQKLQKLQKMRGY